MQPTDVRVEVAGGVRLRVRQWLPADPGGVPFLLVHGLSSNALLWDAVAARLADAGHPAHAIDLRSHGESDAPEAGYDTQTAADDVAAVASVLALPAAVLAGQSWGGNVVVRVAADRPSSVAALALVDGGWIDLASDFTTWVECENALRPPDVDGTAAADIRGFIADAHPQWSRDAVEATLANLRITNGVVHRRLSIDKHMRIVRSMWDDTPWQDFGRILAPALLLPAIAGDAEGAARRRERVAAAASRLRRAQIREYIGGDHDLHAQHPAAIADDLLALAKEG